MTKKSLRSARSMGFRAKPITKTGEQAYPALSYLKHKSSFFVAALSLVAFIAGNMMGQHGWYAFWKAALGQYDDSLITYTGTVTPLALVPDYDRWSQYGGNVESHTFRQVPRELLVPLPAYIQSEQRKSYNDAPRSDVYSVGHMGSYETGADGEGSHIGVDIRVPEGTPVRAVMNGIVSRVSEDPGGFGKLIVIRHSHAPDPDEPRKETVLHSGYAHLSEQLVAEGDIVQKGQTIAYSGKTGYATGPHLHFQIDRDEAPWHPYWAFSYSEARDAGMNTAQAINAGLHSDRGTLYTVHPLLYVQENYPASLIAKKSDVVARTETKRMTPAERRKERIAQRVAARAREQKIVAAESVDVLVASSVAPASPQSAVSNEGGSVSSVPTVTSPVVVQVDTVATTQPVVTKPATSFAQSVASALIQHSGSFGERQWQQIRVTLLDANGSVADAASLTGKLYMRTAFGEAEFDPPILKATDFRDGTAVVRMLPRGTTTVVILIEPLKAMSKPILFKNE